MLSRAIKPRRPRLNLKTAEEIALMRKAGRIVAEVHELMRRMVRPGISTAELDAAAEELIRRRNALPAFKGYPHTGRNDFPATLCTSINEELVHGIPSPKRILREGDIISIDVGAIYGGYYGDAAWTYPVGQISEEAQRLLATTEGALYVAIAAARPGRRLRDISTAIERYVKEHGFNVARNYTGHGIGRQMHEEPQVWNYVDKGYRDGNVVLLPGMTLALEPMVNAGTGDTKVLADGWTVVTADGRLSAHFEHTIVVTEGEPEILTRL
ncbi:MAG: type I methionyl aminopeptidase [Anaerolineae bacterium]|nr:type I methionyl aminopeptidase [Anaerolineae bacterium]MDW8100094.1 type I methionyl aminopeptidase [Anaerolineae bacterium]